MPAFPAPSIITLPNLLAYSATSSLRNEVYARAPANTSASQPAAQYDTEDQANGEQEVGRTAAQQSRKHNVEDGASDIKYASHWSEQEHEDKSAADGGGRVAVVFSGGHLVGVLEVLLPQDVRHRRRKLDSGHVEHAKLAQGCTALIG